MILDLFLSKLANQAFLKFQGKVHIFSSELHGPVTLVMGNDKIEVSPIQGYNGLFAFCLLMFMVDYHKSLKDIWEVEKISWKSSKSWGLLSLYLKYIIENKNKLSLLKQTPPADVFLELEKEKKRIPFGSYLSSHADPINALEELITLRKKGMIKIYKEKHGL